MGRPRSDIEPRIVHAARERFLREGVDGASLRAIAAEASTSVGMISYYFPAKDDLFLAVVEEVYVRVLEDINTALSPDVPLEARLRRLIVRIGAASAEEVDVIRLVVREALVSSSRLDRLFERFQRGHLPLLLGTLAEGMEQGAIDPALPLPLVMMMTAAMGVVPQAMRRVLAGRLPSPPLPAGEELASLLVDRLLLALAPRPAAAAAARPRRAKAKPGAKRKGVARRKLRS